MICQICQVSRLLISDGSACIFKRPCSSRLHMMCIVHGTLYRHPGRRACTSLIGPYREMTAIGCAVQAQALSRLR